jgi:glycosyltransferase involved in cell wall biosynthesis
VAIYLQHSEWAKAVYEPYFGDRCQIWPVGIDTDAWYPNLLATKRFDFLIYDKIRWQREKMISRLLAPIRSELQRRNLSYREIEYGFYSEEQYKEALHSCRYMIFLCEHESQGIAYLEGLASNVPMLAWDQGWCLDPARWAWGQAEIPTTSVPYFDARCGLRFINIQEFSQRLTQFLDLERDGTFAPREYVNENLTLEKCSAWFLRILNDAQVHDRAPDG